MSSIIIRDLKRSTDLDQHAMSAVRGGFSFAPNTRINLNVNQQIFQVQEVGVNVLNNNGMIGRGFVAPKVDVDVLLKAENKAIFPKFD